MLVGLTTANGKNDITKEKCQERWKYLHVKRKEERLKTKDE